MTKFSECSQEIKSLLFFLDRRVCVHCPCEVFRNMCAQEHEVGDLLHSVPIYHKWPMFLLLFCEVYDHFFGLFGIQCQFI